MNKRTVVAFDFDGTITRKDTMLEFIKFTKGHKSFYMGFLLYTPLLIAFKLKLYPNWKLKQKIFNHFFRKMSIQEFRLFGEKFADIVETIVRPKAIVAIKKHLAQNDTIYVVSASIDEWVIPWCRRIGIKTVLGTQVEVDQQEKLTGKFSSANCYGQDKVNRLLEVEPDRDSYILYAYGDSCGDKELIEFADKGWYNNF